MKIASITTTPLALPFRKPYYWTGRVAHGTSLVLVRVGTDEGLVGIGESTAAPPAEGTARFLQGVAPLFLGEPVFDIERLFARARTLGGFAYTPWFANLVLAGLEMALWDIIGQAVGRPVYQFLGGAAHPQVDYFGFPQGDRAEELAEDAAAMVAVGYSVIYIKVGRGEAVDLRNVAAVRAVIGSRRLRLDANGAWDVRTAIYMIRKLAQFEPEWIEQPTPEPGLAALRQVKESVPIPIAADQAVFTANEVYEICRQRAADVIVLSIHEAGGLLALKKAAAIADAAGIAICLHGQSVSSITDLAQQHIGLTVPNLADGNQIMHQLLVEDMVDAPDLTPAAGKLAPPTRPGLGLTLNEDAVGRAAERYLRDERYQHA